MPRAKRPLCNRQFLVALIPHRRVGGWIYCINNSIPFQGKPEEGSGISSIAFHDRSLLMGAQAGGIYLFIHPNIYESPVPARVVVASKVSFYFTKQLSTATPTGVQDPEVV